MADPSGAMTGGAAPQPKPIGGHIMNSMSLNTETWEKKGTYRNGYLLNFVLGIKGQFCEGT